MLWIDAAPTGSAAAVWAIIRFPEGGGTSLIPFELYDDIIPGAVDANAYPMKPDLSDADTSASFVKVSDEILKNVRAWGRSHFSSDSTWRGARGFYIIGSDGKNQIVAIKRLARLIRVTAPSSDTAAGGTYWPCWYCWR